mgnify:CR=1 FL=1
MSKTTYWVPALERAHRVLQLIAEEPGKLKLTDLCKRLGISKSTMFSLLQTMEALDWIYRKESDTFSLGGHFGYLGNAYFRQHELVGVFRREAPNVMKHVNETLHLAKLDKNDVIYLAKEQSDSPVQMVSGPGARFPAHATALGKMLLSGLTDEEICDLYPQEELLTLTPYTLKTRKQLLEHLQTVRKQGYAIDQQEGVMGFNCVAAPVYGANGRIIAAVSCSMPIHHWEQKQAKARKEICQLAQKLSAESY